MKTHRLVFVYGTLKSGHGNNAVLHTGEAKLIGYAVTMEKYFLFGGGFPKMARTLGPRQLPHIKAAKYAGRVVGEVWRIDDRSLAACDGLESNGVLYQRHEIDVKLHKDARVGKVWAYFILHTPPYSDLILPNKGKLEWVGR